MFDVCACLWSAPLRDFCGEVGNWNWLEESGGAPLDLLSSGEIVPCF